LKYKKAFLNQDLKENTKLRFPEDQDRMNCKNNLLKYLEDVAKGKKKLNVKSVFVHEIVEKLLNHITKSDLSVDEIALLEACWISYIDQYRKKIKEEGIKLDRGVVLCDVSGSMNGIPMIVSISMAIFISELINEPYRHRFITFESEPQWFNIPPQSTLLEKIKLVKGSPWGGSTNFSKAMDLVLNIAEANKLKNDQLPTWFLVLSDMQFDVANAKANWNTMHEEITERFKQVGLRTIGEPYHMPHMIYWNLRATGGFTVQSSTKNTQLISGFSIDLLKELFVSQDLSNVTPWSSLESILKNKRYDPIRQKCFEVLEHPYFTSPNLSKKMDGETEGETFGG
jgi:hypothetical protein